MKSLRELPLFFRPIALFFSEAYRSGTIWLTIFIGVLLNKIIATFLYFIGVLSFLFLFLLIEAYRQRKND